MSRSFSNKLRGYRGWPLQKHDWRALIVFPAWVLAAFLVSQLIVGVSAGLLASVIDIARLGSPAVIQTTVSAAVYAVAFAITFGVPYLVMKRRVSLQTLGLERLMTWVDIGLAPLAYIAYVLTLLIVLAVVTNIPGFQADQAQEIGFKALTNQAGYILAFTTLVVIAPIAEEILFRGYLYGKLRRHVPVWAAVMATSILFAGVHGQWNVAVDTFVLSLFLCGLRELTGSVWAGVLVHMIKNAIAFYILFLAPLLTPGLGS